ncbi:MAG TPA: FAD:protein FMN transferase [Bdellovibrionota bacterium]|nr:FAD:protein FMN transferase [Bdellovibrionota bacterium]
MSAQVFWAFMAASALAAPAPPERLERQVAAMGTRLVLAIEAGSRASALEASDRAIEAVHAAEKRLSSWREDSEISTLNRSEPGTEVPISPRLERDLGAAFACARLTERSFDPAIGPLVAAWDLRGKGRVPSAAEIDEARRASDVSQFELKPGRILRRSSAAKLEEGGFGKGAGLDDAAAALKASGVRSAMLDFGGQVLTLGEGEREIRIASPAKRDEVLLTLKTREGSVSTSGNSEHGLSVRGRRVGHIVDPKTGKPASFDGSVTAIAPTGIEADCLSTGLYVMGPGRGLEFVRERGAAGKVEAVFVSRARRGWLAQASCGLKGKLKPQGAAVRIVFDCPTKPGEAP